MRTSSIHRILSGLFLALTGSVFAEPVIAEFMASNQTTLKDGHGDYEDWIEIWNPESESVDLSGWRLTDNRNQPSKFVFPSVVVPAGGRIVVFASNRVGSTGGQTYVDPEGYLHTNFALSQGGEYLALVRPDGSPVDPVLDPYPRQVEDISYGPPSMRETLVGSSTPAVYRVPTNASADTASPPWTSNTYNSASWTAHPGGGVGFEVGTPVAGWMLDESAGSSSAADFSGVGFTAGLNGSGQTFGVSGAHAGSDTAVQFNGNGGLTIPYQAALNPAATFSVAIWAYPSGGSDYRTVISTRQSSGNNRGYILYLSPFNRWEFWTGANGGSSWEMLNGGTAQLNQWTHLVITRDASGVKRIYVNGVQTGTATQGYAANTDTSKGLHIGCGNDLGQSFRFVGKIDDIGIWNKAISPSLIEQHRTGGISSFPSALYPGYFQTDVETAMFGVNPGIYTRHAFSMADVNRFGSLKLRMKYDDGFIAFLNGVEILRRNASATRQFNMLADSDRGDSQAIIFEETDISSAALPLLVNGNNTLAIHGMTHSAAAGDFLLTPELEATLVPGAEASGYFAVSTPGVENIPTLVNPGPEVSEISHSPLQPSAGQGITVTCRITPRLAAIQSVSLKYRVMYGSDSSAITMTDIGPAPLATDGSRIFSGTIPPNHGATARQMIRYYITTSDVAGRSWRAPYPVDLTNTDGVSQSPEYFGTVVADPALISTMPIMQWFTADVSNSNTRTGSRASVWYAGRFYDNIYVRQRGGYTSGGSQKFNFNARNGVYVNETLGTVGELNLNTSGGDSNSYRVSGAYGIYRAAGMPAPESFPVALIMNGSPQRIAHCIEQIDEDFLQRHGFDDEGALYKMVQRLGEESTPGNVNAGDYSGSPAFKLEDPIYGVEKKTRLYEDFSDYTDFTAGIVPTASVASRREFLLRNLNLPNFVNFMAIRSIVSDQDVNRKNFYAYRDTRNSGEWFLFPWDKDMTLGVNYSTSVSSNRNNPWQSTNTYKHDPGSTRQWSVLWQAGLDIPEVRAMVGRRLRTLMDNMMGAPGTPIPGNTLFEQQIEIVREALLTPPPGFSTGSGYRSRTSFNDWLANHRTALFTTYGPSSSFNMTATAASAAPSIELENADANPSAAAPGYVAQDHEYIVLANPNTDAIDLSGWTLWNPGAAEPIYTFAAGTVIPGAASAPLNRLHVARNIAGFRARPDAPVSAEWVVGPYQGQLSARGETIELRDGLENTSRLVDTLTTPSDPTQAQQFLRITELMYAPTGPTPSELFLAPGTEAADYEFIELQNTGSAPLDLSGARFTDGVEFTFPTTVLPAGGRVLVVSNLAAFTARYGGSAGVAGAFTGNLNNTGERIRIEDASGEQVLQFTYQNQWFPPALGGGHSLVVRNAAPDHLTYDQATHWALSGANGGSPGEPDATFAQHYTGWLHEHFTPAELYQPGTTILNPATTDPLTDADGDGLDLFTEYAFGLDPRVPDRFSLLDSSSQRDGEISYLVLAYNRRAHALDLAFSFEASSTLAADWQAAAPDFVGSTNLGNSIERVTFREAISDGAPPRFLRVRALKP